MNNLARIIGPAPSELEKPELIARLSNERKRVSIQLDLLRSAPRRAPGKRATIKQTTHDKIIEGLAKEAGMTVEEFQSIMMELKEQTNEREDL